MDYDVYLELPPCSCFSDKALGKPCESLSAPAVLYAEFDHPGRADGQNKTFTSCYSRVKQVSCQHEIVLGVNGQDH